MAGQGLFFRASNLVNNCRFLLNNRVFQINGPLQVSGLKQSVTEKLKELKVPQKPKRPLTAYFKFIQDQRQAIKKQHPEWKVTDISRQCAADWKAIDPSIKEQYEREYKQELEVYEKKFLEYSAELTDEQKEALKVYSDEVKKSKVKRRLKKKLRENNKPKRPIGAYMMFVMDEGKGQNKSYSQLLTELKSKWAELPANEKSKYLDAANRAKKLYEEELNRWELKMIQEGNEDIVRKATLAEKRPTKLIPLKGKVGKKDAVE